MVSLSAHPGNTVLMPSGPTGLHLFVIVLGPAVLPSYGSGEQLVLVSATSLREGLPHDPACVLQPGDHPFIRQPSYIAYRHMRLDRAQHVGDMVQRAIFAPHEACSQALLERIRAGVSLSRLSSREFKRLFGSE